MPIVAPADEQDELISPYCETVFQSKRQYQHPEVGVGDNSMINERKWYCGKLFEEGDLLSLFYFAKVERPKGGTKEDKPGEDHG